MLNDELNTVLRGWSMEKLTMPLSCREYCAFKGINTESWLAPDLAKMRNALYAYNNEGGFPQVVLTENPLRKTKILHEYFDLMLLKDIGEFYRLSNIKVLRYYLKRIMASLTKPLSIMAIHRDIKAQG